MRQAVLRPPGHYVMSDEPFHSGPWVGFYNYFGHSRKFPMDLILEFTNGVLAGEGQDGVGPFVILGNYSVTTRECTWKKTYVGRHTVEYRGFGENGAIWGTWTLSRIKGGFHIWPLAGGVPLAVTEEEDVSTQPKKSPHIIPA